MHPSNILLKYADDTYLLVLATNSSLISHELKNISDWAIIFDNLKLNSTKCYDMVVSLSNKNRPHIPPPLQGLTRVEEMTVLGVTFTHTMSFAPHILKVTGKTAASLYALKTLKAHGLHGQALCDVTQATLVAQLLYASPAWSGFIKADEKAKLLEYLFESSDTTLFSAILRRPGHVLHPLLPPLKTTGYHLHKRSHGLKLSAVQSRLLRKNFIYRMLYTDIY